MKISEICPKEDVIGYDDERVCCNLDLNNKPEKESHNHHVWEIRPVIKDKMYRSIDKYVDIISKSRRHPDTA